MEDKLNAHNQSFASMNGFLPSKQHIVTAVRIRPLSEDELSQGNKVITSVDEDIVNGLKLLDPTYFKADKEKNVDKQTFERAFNYDHVFWSLADHPNYASQHDVYNECGSNLVSHCLDGFNCSLIAFGQTVSVLQFSSLNSFISVLL